MKIYRVEVILWEIEKHGEHDETDAEPIDEEELRPDFTTYEEAKRYFDGVRRREASIQRYVEYKRKLFSKK